MKRGEKGTTEREIASMVGEVFNGYADHPVLGNGKIIFVRSVAYHYVAEVVYATPTEIMVRRVTWVADTGKDLGRWGTTLAKGFAPHAELEVYPPDLLVLLEREAGSELGQWPHDLPTKSQ